MSINHTMIDREGHIGHWKYQDCVLTGDLFHNDTLLQLTNSKDRCLSLVKNDGRCDKRARNAMV